MTDLLRPDSTEVLANMLFGFRGDQPPLPKECVDVFTAFEGAVLPALRNEPCGVSFSGGRDSSAILALAAAVARKHDLPLPIPLTLRFTGAPETEEAAWQRLVLKHLGLDNQEFFDFTHELDAVGPVAHRSLRRFGLLWPANAYMHMPLFEGLGGGSLLTGAGGDELLGSRGDRVVLLLRGRVRPRRADLRHTLRLLRPLPKRAALWRTATLGPDWYPWLTEAGRERLLHVWARDEMAWPLRWDRAVAHWRTTRVFAALESSIPALGASAGVTVCNPFLNPPVLSALMGMGGATGFADRADAMRQLFGHLLPEAVLSRESKANFSAPVLGSGVQAFAREWDGDGVDHAMVDAEALRGVWLSERPDFRTAMLLHSAWLTAQATDSTASSI